MPEDSEPRPRLDPSTVDDLADRTKRFFSDLARDYVRRPVDDLLRWILRRTVAYLVAAALFITAAVFLLVGGVEGLAAADVPSWVAYLSIGVLGLLAGVIVLYAGKPQRHRDTEKNTEKK